MSIPRLLAVASLFIATAFLLGCSAWAEDTATFWTLAGAAMLAGVYGTRDWNQLRKDRTP